MSPGSCTRSAAPATYSAYRKLPVRWRLGGGSALFTFLILAIFAVAIGTLTTRQISDQFIANAQYSAQVLQAKLHVAADTNGGTAYCPQYRTGVDLQDFASADAAQVRVIDQHGKVICTQLDGTAHPATLQPHFKLLHKAGVAYQQHGYQLAAEPISLPHHAQGWVIYGLPLSSLHRTINWIHARLAFAVFGGTLLALLAGFFVAQRAMRPVAELTDVARDIERTRDPTLRIPHPEAEDEVAELARTLERMLAALDAARGESELALARQREFVADASHELRTPLTAILANLELLADELAGEQAESASSALRSARRMRELVANLLLLARADAHRQITHLPIDLGVVLTNVAAEVGPMADSHELVISPGRAVVYGAADDLHRMILNLVENAINHTPPGTLIEASTETDDRVIVRVADNGTGIPPEQQARVFERFFRGGGDTGGGRRGSGLGLAIVTAVAQAHGATITLSSTPDRVGTCFEIRFPLDPAASPSVESGGRTDQTSTITGSTMGRRLRRS